MNSLSDSDKNKRKTEKITSELIDSDDRFSDMYIVIDFKEQDIVNIIGGNDMGKSRFGRMRRKEKAVKKARDDGQSLCFSVPAIVSDLYRGDFSINFKHKLLVLIERKTWKDLSDSFKDGRIHNMSKLLKAREQTGCTVMYIIEGKPSASLNVDALQSHLDHVVFRDNVHVVYTKDLTSTISRINRMMKNYQTLPSFIAMRKGIELKGGETEVSKQPDENEVDHMALLQTKEKKSDDTIRRELFMSIPGISEKTYDILSGMPLKRILRGKLSETELSALKYPSGVSVGSSRAKKIMEPFARPSIKHAKIYIKVISQIPGIGKKTAELLIKELGFEKLVRVRDPDVISSIKTGTRTIGPSKAKNIIKYVRI